MRKLIDRGGFIHGLPQTTWAKSEVSNVLYTLPCVCKFSRLMPSPTDTKHVHVLLWSYLRTRSKMSTSVILSRQSSTCSKDFALVLREQVIFKTRSVRFDCLLSSVVKLHTGKSDMVHRSKMLCISLSTNPRCNLYFHAIWNELEGCAFYCSNHYQEAQINYPSQRISRTFHHRTFKCRAVKVFNSVAISNF